MDAGWFRAFFWTKTSQQDWWSSFWLTRSARKSGTHVLSNGRTSPTLRKWTRDDLEHFFEQKHLSKTGVEKPPKSSCPAFCKVLPSRAPCRQRYGQARYKADKTAQLKRCLWRWQEDERSLSPAREHAACCAWTHWGVSPGPSACEADVIPLHHVPLSHCSHGVTHTKTCQVVFWLTRSARKSGTHVLSNGHTSPTLRKWTRDDLEHFFWTKTSQQDWCRKAA